MTGSGGNVVQWVVRAQARARTGDTALAEKILLASP